MIVRQILEVPADHRLTIEVPWEITTARVVLTLTPEPASEPVSKKLPGMYANTVEEALQMAAEIVADPNRRPISSFFGILSPSTYGDGVAYQRALRDEWDD